MSIRKMPIPGLEDDWNLQADIPMCSIEMAFCVHEINGHGTLQQCKGRLNLDIFLL